MSILLVFILALTLLVFYKYHIDTQITIKEITKDRNQFRANMWKFINSRTKEIEYQKNFVNPYNALKLKIAKLSKDIEETEFKDFDNVKEEILSALKDIDSYGE
jgi:hypothetical protein